jgi:hypothetical protein
MKRLIRLLLVSVVLAMGMWPQAGAALDLKDGFFDIPWGVYLNDLEGFEPLSQDTEIAYYVKPDRVYRISDIEVANVIYGFYADRFSAVYIAVDGIDVFGQLKKYITQKYGTPSIKMETRPQQTVYTWKHQRVKIKMKHRELEGSMKLGFYYTPLTGRANRASAEAFEPPPKARFPLSDQKRREAVEHYNLLNF